MEFGSYLARFMQRVRPLDHLVQRPLRALPLVPVFLRALVPLNLRQTFLPFDRPNFTHLRAMRFRFLELIAGAWPLVLPEGYHG